MAVNLSRPTSLPTGYLLTLPVLALFFIGGSMQVVSAGQAQTCFGREATIVGTSGNDRLVGTPGTDVIIGRNGHDVIHGRGGDDFICGNLGFEPEPNYDTGDDLFGGPGNDHLDGGFDGNSMSGGTGNDLIRTGQGSAHSEGLGDRLRGGPGKDRLVGGRLYDDIVPGPGRDYVDGGGNSQDSINFAASNRRIILDLRKGFAYGQGRDRVRRIEWVHGSRFDDVITGRRGSNHMWGGRGDDRVTLRRGNDWTYGGAGDDVLRGGRGNDELNGASGQDDMFGGSGTDRCYERRIRHSCRFTRTPPPP